MASLLLLVAGCMYSCQQPVVEQPEPITETVPVTGIELNRKSLSLLIDGIVEGAHDGTETLIATIYPDNATDKSITWASSDENVVTISQEGMLTAVDMGEAVVTVTTGDGGKTAECKVKVTDTAIYVTSITLDQETVVLDGYYVVRLTATVLPEDATDPTVVWSSSHKTVATVDEEGRVTGVGAGLATISATTREGGLQDDCEIKVVPIVRIATQPAKTITVAKDGDPSVIRVKANSNITASLAYQWYSNTTESNEGGTAVAGANAASFPIPAGKEGDFFYFCEVSALDGEVKVRSDVSAVKVADPAIHDNGVIINGLKWATRNVETKGKFAPTPESPGLLYQWQRDIAWSTTDPLRAWDTEGNEISDVEWDTSYHIPYYPWTSVTDPCPDGWTVPTSSHFFYLMGGEYGPVSREYVPATETSLGGLKFTDDNTGATLFLPASGRRSGDTGQAYHDGSGLYWYEYRGCFYFGTLGSFSHYSWTSSPASGANGLPVRCVEGEKYVRNE